jgi:hypothetical protein
VLARVLEVQSRPLSVSDAGRVGGRRLGRVELPGAGGVLCGTTCWRGDSVRREGGLGGGEQVQRGGLRGEDGMSVESPIVCAYEQEQEAEAEEEALGKRFPAIGEGVRWLWLVLWRPVPPPTQSSTAAL